MKTFYALIAVFVLCVIAGIALILWPAPQAPTSNNGQQATSTPSGDEGDTIAGISDLIMVGTPTKGDSITSPLTITGSARGFWYFEATFPVEIRDASGKVIAQHYAEAQSEWMTEDFVIFKATISYPAQPKGSKGTVILRNSNASGDPERDKSVEIPVVFQ